MESGREATGQSGRGRPAREASGKRKTSENANVFCNLTSPGAAGSRTSGSSAMVVQKLPSHFQGVRHPAAPGENGRPKGRTASCHLSLRHSGWRAGGKNSRGGAEARRAWRGRILHKRTKRKQKGQLESGRNANIEKHENRFADMERGRGATGQSGRGRPARGASGKRKTSENSNAFCNLAPAMDSTSGGAASCRAMADGERVNGSRKVRNVRKGLERCRAMPRSMGRQGARFLRLGVCVWLCFDSNYAHGKMRVFPSGYLARFALIPIMRMAKCEEQPDVIRKALP